MSGRRYDEGPFREWTAVKFGGKLAVVLKTPLFGQPGVLDGTCSIGGVDGYEPPVDALEGYLVGSISGAVVFTGGVPVTAPFGSGAVTPPGCSYNLTDVYTLNGLPVSTEPAVGYNRTIEVPGFGARFNIVSRQSHTYDPGDPGGEPPIPPSCVANANAPNWPIFPMFQIGEGVTRFKEWPPT